MDEQGVRRAVAAYGLEVKTVRPRQQGYRNYSYAVELADGRLINFLLYKNEPGITSRIAHANTAGDFLAQQGVPARRTISARIISLKSSNTIRYGALYNYLPGATIPWEAYTKNHIKLVGMAMGRMHRTFRESDQIAPLVVDEYSAIIERMTRYFSDAQVLNALQEKLGITITFDLGRCAKVVAFCRDLPGRQLLHMDFVRGNLLFGDASPGDVFQLDDLSLKGIIDFEKVAYGHPIFDLARTLAFLLVDCKYKAPDKVRKYFLYSGYEKRGIMGEVSYSSRLLEEMVSLFLLYDFYKFLRHNPYEFLHQNEHFVRTKDMLRARSVLS